MTSLPLLPNHINGPKNFFSEITSPKINPDFKIYNNSLEAIGDTRSCFVDSRSHVS